MTPLAPLPLPLEALPASLRRFCDPSAPVPARTMAAKGLVPVKGGDLLTVLAQLSADATPAIAEAATASLSKLPEGVLLSACDEILHPSVLDAVARLVNNVNAQERIVANHATSDVTVERIAHTASESLAERIATNEARLLAAPEIIEALYKNKRTRMSTADRLVDLAVRNGVQVTGIPTFAAHAEALQTELLPEATAEPLPTDIAFQQALADDLDDPDIVEVDAAGTEQVKANALPLSMQVSLMSNPEKIRLSLVGNAAARALLVRDNNKQVAHSAIASPSMTVNEAVAIANSRQIGEDILRFIGNKKEWVRSYEVKRALLFNSKTPVGISLRFLSHLHESDLRELSRSRNVAGPLKAAAVQRIMKKDKQSGGD
ncbi:MAG: hypothetical protein IPK60_23335 [Sandaracinaceae bacterium]|nr:hypothetical protein [Sandaracinaceae bacterium]